MKTKKTSIVLLFTLCSMTSIIYAQNTTLEYNSSANPEDPHLLLMEVGDGGATGDGWARMWFKNQVDTDNRWGFLARPQSGALDNQELLASPLVMAYTGVQKFGFGMDGHLAINKSYVLPNEANSEHAGQALLITGDTTGNNSTVVTDWGFIDYSEKNSTPADATLELHENSNGAAHLSFSNNQFANNRFFIRADPSSTSGENAAMRLGWGNVGSGLANDIVILDGNTNNVGIGVDPYQSFRLHVEGPKAAAHFGPQSSAFPAVGYVTVNRPAGNSAVQIFKIRDADSTIADFNDDEIEFYQPTTIRGDLKIFDSDLSLLGASPGDISAANGNFSGTVTASCGVLSCSDLRYKTNINTIPSVLQKIDQISAVYYDWDLDNHADMGFSRDRQVGVIAQELETVFPELVQTKEDGYKVVAYDKLAPVVLQAVKEQQVMIDELKADNKIMKDQLASLMKTLK